MQSSFNLGTIKLNRISGNLRKTEIKIRGVDQIMISKPIQLYDNLIKKIITQIINIMRSTALLFFLFLIYFSNSASSDPIWSFTNQVQAGIKIIVQNQAHLDSSNQYVYTYSPAFSSTPNTALGIIHFQVADLHQTHLKFKVNIPDYTSTTQLTVNMDYAADTVWRHFKTSYIAIDTLFSQVKVDYFAESSLTNVSTGVGTRSFSGVFVLNIGPIDVSHTLTLIPFLVGVDSTTVAGQHTLLWTVDIRDAYTINYDLTVKHTTRVTEIVSYLLIVDRTDAEQGYELFLDQIEVTGNENIPNMQTLVASDPSTIHLGLGSFQFTLVAFEIDRDLTLTTAGYYNQIKISVWNYRRRACAPAEPYYEIVSNLCYDTCPNNSINANGPNLKYCELCGQFIDGCQFCEAGGSICTSCFGNYDLATANTTCQCPDGYYESALPEYQDSSLKCRICHEFCETCSESTENDCLTCPERRTFNGTYCVCDDGAYPNGQCMNPCNDTYCLKCENDTAVCQECEQTFQLESERCLCGERRYFDLSTKRCYDCDPTCQYCDGPLQNNCIFCSRSVDLRYLDEYSYCQCISNYIQINGTCEREVQTECLQEGYELDKGTSMCFETCGDGILHELDCDDGNNNNKDGCSSNCKVEDGFMCADNSLAPNSRSYCSFIGPIQFELKWVEKDIYYNEANFTFTMKPVLNYIFEVYYELTHNTTFQPRSKKVTTKSAVFDPETELLNVEIEYLQDLEEKYLTLVFKIPETAETFAIPVSRSRHHIKTDNILATIVYDDLTYENVRIVNVIFTVCYIGSLVVGSVLMFFRKMMALQLIVMFQFVYFGILLADYSHPFLGPIQGWDYINGYNDLVMREDPTQQTLVDNTFKVYSYYHHFLDNCNVMIFLNLSLYVIALIVLLLSLLAEKPTAKKFTEGSKFFVIEIGFALMVFSLNNWIVGLAMEIYSGAIGDFSFLWSKVFGIIACIIIIVHISIFFFNVHILTDSSLYYKKHKEYTHFFPVIFILRNVLLITSVVLRPVLMKDAVIMTLCVQGVYVLVVLIGRPYRKPIDWVRGFLVEVTLFGFIGARFVEAQYIQTQYRNQWGRFFLYSAFLIVIGCVFSFIFTLISFIYHFCRGLKKEKGEKDDEKAQQYLPPPLLIKDKDRDLSENKDLFSPDKTSNEKQTLLKSRQMMILDVDDDETGGSVPNNSIYDQSSRRQFRDETKGKKKKKNPYV